MLHFLNDTSITCFAFGWQCLLKSLHVRAYIVGAATSKVLFATVTALMAAISAPVAFAGGHGRIFNFVGINGHTVTGRAEIVGTTVHLLDDFRFDGAPDPKIALGLNGVYDPATLSGQLENFSGASSFELPAGIDPANYNEVWVWCERFNVGLATATEA